jgi:hypothetical protein
MASERQIAANRRNGNKSTGPRSASGKKRASHNAVRYGLTLRLSGAEFLRQIDIRARQIAGNIADQIALESARDAAEAELELDRINRLKVALIERVAAFGKLKISEPVDPLPPMPAEEPARSAEAVRRILPELLRLQRYESRAVTRRDRAIRAFTFSCKSI